MECRGDEGGACRDLVFGLAVGDGDGAEVEEVDKLGVSAELEIEAEGFGKHLLDGVGSWNCGEAEEVDFLPKRLGLALEGLELVQRAEGLNSGEAVGVEEDGADGGVKSLRVFWEMLF